MRDKDIHIGDVLQIRQWDDMENEFGLNGLGSVNCYLSFTEGMKYMCGQQFTVVKVHPGALSRNAYESQELIESSHGRNWHISADMLEPFMEEDLYVANDGDFSILLMEE